MVASYIQNRTPHSAIDGDIPYKRWFGKDPNFDILRIFGSRVYAHIPSVKRKKLDSKAKEMVFVGYSTESKGYRLLNPENDAIIISRDVKFCKSYMDSRHIVLDEQCQSKNEPEAVIDILGKDDDVEPGTDDGEIVDDRSQSSDVANDTCDLRRSKRNNFGIPAERFSPDLAGIASEFIHEPTNYREAVESSNAKKWLGAMQDEFESLVKNGTWDLVPLPQGRKPVGSKWVYKVKEDINGDVARFKARLVAQGYSQKYGEDYDQVFAPVVKQTTMRLMLTIAGSRNYYVEHFDIKTAFLYGELDETIFMKQPIGFEVKGQEHMVCKLRRSLYGLKQSARAWNKKIDSTLIKFGFQPSTTDPCLYSRMINGKYMYLLIYVDDIIIAFDNKEEIRKIGDKLSSVFEIVALGDIQQFLGLEVERNLDGTYSIGQRKYIEKTLQRFGMESAKGSPYPLDPGYLKQNSSPELPNNDQYRRIIGSLLYLAVNSRPDIAAATSILSRKVSCPTALDLCEAKRTLRYLKQTVDHKLKLGDGCVAGLTGYVDADWGGDKADGKSMSGVIFKYNGAAVSWMSRKQNCVSLSSTEAEYIALSEAVKEFSWICELIKDFHEPVPKPTIIFEDNQGCIKLANNERMGRNTKHINTRYNFVKEFVENGSIKLEYCPTETMIADIFTKPLHGQKMRRFSEMLGLVRSFATEEECWDYGNTVE